ncbi:MAG: hypothetical protein ABFS18_02150 [Thermodesulfobacteriota bacterium]
MARTEIIAAIGATIKGVAPKAKIHERERFKSSWSDFLTLFKTTDGLINGFTVTRKAKARRSVTAGQVEEASVMMIRGWYGLKDEANSEAAFQDQVDGIDAALLADESLQNTCETTHPDWGPMGGAVGLQADLLELRKFGTVLCHYFEGRICAIELVDI